jgi:hypothetical protein
MAVHDPELLVPGHLLQPSFNSMYENKVHWDTIGGHWASASQQNVVNERKSVY